MAYTNRVGSVKQSRAVSFAAFWSAFEWDPWSAWSSPPLICCSCWLVVPKERILGISHIHHKVISWWSGGWISCRNEAVWPGFRRLSGKCHIVCAYSCSSTKGRYISWYAFLVKKTHKARSFFQLCDWNNASRTRNTGLFHFRLEGLD